MAKFELYIDELLKHEGGWSNHKYDPGKQTKLGITLATWRQYGHDKDNDGDIDEEDLRVISVDDAKAIYKPKYWDKVGGDKISNQAVANIIFDHAVNAGVGRAAKMAQAILKTTFGKKNLVVDGAIGPKTLAELNAVNPSQFHDEFKLLRADYYNYLANNIELVRPMVIKFLQSLGIAPNSKFQAFIKGWMNRVNTFTDLFKKKSLAIGSTVLLVSIGLGLVRYYQKIKS